MTNGIAQNANLKQAPRGEDGLFDGSPLIKLQHSIGLKPPSYPRSLQWACLAVLVGWAPLLILCMIEGTAFLPEEGFLADIAVHARSLIAVPILIFAELICAPRMSGIVRHFLDAGLIAESDRARFNEAIASTRRLRDSNLADMILTALSYILVIVMLSSVPVQALPAWHWSGTTVGSLSLAGWWHGLVSLPLLSVLLLGWLWRLFLWGRFLWLIARLDLRLVPAHPDLAGGLMFLGSSLQALCILALAISVIVAGTIANNILHQGMQILDARYTIAGLVIVNLAIFCSPFLVFGQNMFRARLRGIAQYGALAGRVGRQFEGKWLDRGKADVAGALEAQDFSATTDLYQIVANVYDMRMVPLTIRGVLPLVGATLAPFVPVAFMVLPFDVIFSKVAGMMF